MALAAHVGAARHRVELNHRDGLTAARRWSKNCIENNATAAVPFVGNGQQGFGIRAQTQPPVFDPCTQHMEAFRFWEENRFVVVQALSACEVREMNDIADRGWLREYAHTPSELMVFYPLLDYSAVDKFINHPSTMPLISQMLGGWQHVRFQEFNWRYYPENYGLAVDGVAPPAGSYGMRFHADASLPDRFSRQPYGPPDYVSAFYCTPVGFLPRCSCASILLDSERVLFLLRPDRHASSNSVLLRRPEVNPFQDTGGGTRCAR